MSEKIVVLAGGTGLIGRRLAQLLREQHYEVRTLTRRPAAPGEYAWDPAKGSVDAKALDDAYAVINLAGAGIAPKAPTPCANISAAAAKCRPVTWGLRP
jgi:uncharacterized protein